MYHYTGPHFEMGPLQEANPQIKNVLIGVNGFGLDKFEVLEAFQRKYFTNDIIIEFAFLKWN